MTVGRLLAVALIYVCTAVAWFTLGGTIVARTGEFDQRLAVEVGRLWGGKHEQLAPEAHYERPRLVTEDAQSRDNLGRPVTQQVTKTVIDSIPIVLDSSRVKVELSLDPRRKGLLWYATYGVAFQGSYRLHNPDSLERTVVVKLTFPSTEALYDGFTFRLNGEEPPRLGNLAQGVTARAAIAPAATATVDVAYRSRGLGQWTYAFAPAGVAQVRDFRLDMLTDFARVDFPAGTISPTRKERVGRGWNLSWRFESLVTGQKLGMDPPAPLNPGPFASRVTFFAPVSLLFFFTVLVVLGVLRGTSLHPMNYFFLAAAFFAFHLLLAYLVDHVSVHAAFAIAAATSVLLVTSYLRLVAGARYALLEAGLSQLVYLVLFSYAFFFEGYTGLTITVGAVLTLFVLMQATGRLDWGRALGGDRSRS